jgi:hypothetical protein
VPAKNGVFMIWRRVTYSVVTIPVVRKAVNNRYIVISGLKLNTPEAMARGGETREPIMVSVCCRSRSKVRRTGTRSLSPRKGAL